MSESLSGPVHVFSLGLWRLRGEVAHMSGLTPQRSLFTAGSTGAVAGWGHKPTANRARAAAQRRHLPYLAFEDGFLRSLHPGPGQRPSSLILDRSGIYYDARGPSDLETILQSGTISSEECTEASSLRALIASRRLSKYNTGTDSLDGLIVPAGRPVVIVVDQTRDDQSVAGGLANAASFATMLEAAVNENPAAAIIAKLHPDVITGQKHGYLAQLVAHRGGVQLAHNICPWAVFDLQPKIYTVSSQFGFEALLAGCEVICFGVPFYAGWGLTEDRTPIARRTAKLSLDQLSAAVYLRYTSYFDAWRRNPVDAATAIDQLDFLRRQYFGNASPVVCLGIARWKHKAVAAMLDGPHGKPIFTRSRSTAMKEARKRKAAIVAWGVNALSLRQHAGVPVIAVEDGFIRSAGLGAAFVQPLSLVFDRQGLYYDASRPSDIEQLLALADFDKQKITRARALRLRLVAEHVTKYNLVDEGEAADLPENRTVILVPGQVADDWAVKLGIPPVDPALANVNAELLASVRQRNPGAYVIFKPHPDVEHLGRAGALTAAIEKCYADRIIRTASLEPLLGLVDRLETYCSLAGFEALLRELPVVVHGLPFYAGWGLTGDLVKSERRGRRRTLDELVAAAVIDYPRYWDPVSALPCPPEVALDRLSQLRGRQPSAFARVAMLAGRALIAWRRVWAWSLVQVRKAKE